VVECQLPKLDVAGSSPVPRSNSFQPVEILPAIPWNFPWIPTASPVSGRSIRKSRNGRVIDFLLPRTLPLRLLFVLAAPYTQVLFDLAEWQMLTQDPCKKARSFAQNERAFCLSDRLIKAYSPCAAK
jgi:hypothetical protein